MEHMGQMKQILSEPFLVRNASFAAAVGGLVIYTIDHRTAMQSVQMIRAATSDLEYANLWLK